MKFLSIFKLVSYVSDLISQLITALIINGSPLKAHDMGNCSYKCLHHKCVKSGDNNTNVNNDGSSGETKNTKSMSSEDNSDKDNEDVNNNYSKSTTHPNPVITNYYCYDQRVYNIYKLHESQPKSSGFGILEAIRILNWKYIFITLALVICTTAPLCYLGADMFNWFIFHKVFGYLFSNHFSVVRSDVPV